MVGMAVSNTDIYYPSQYLYLHQYFNIMATDSDIFNVAYICDICADIPVFQPIQIWPIS